MYSKSQSSSPKPLEYTGLPSSISAPSLLSLQKSSQPFKNMNSSPNKQNKQHNKNNQRKIYNNGETSEIIRAPNSLCIINNNSQPQQSYNNNNSNRYYSRNLQQQKKFNKNSIDNLSNLLDKSYITKPIALKPNTTNQIKPLSPPPEVAEADEASRETGAATSSDVGDVAKKQPSSVDINPIVMDEESIKLYLPLLHVAAEFIENQMDHVVSDDQIPEDPVNSSFNAEASPNISVFQYLRRILKYTMFDEEIFIITVIYLDRLKRLNPKFQYNNLNIHRLIMTCALLSSKFQNEKTLDNRYYAQVGGVSLSEINVLELKMLALLDFNLFVCREEFDKYLKVVQTGVDDFRRAQSPPQSASASPPPISSASTTPPPTTTNSHLSPHAKPFRQKSNSYQTSGQPLNSFVSSINKFKSFHQSNYNTYPPPQPIYYNYQVNYQNVEYQSYVPTSTQQTYNQPYPYQVYQPTVMYQQDLTTPPSEQSSAWNYYYSQPIRQQQSYNHFRYPQYPN